MDKRLKKTFEDFKSYSRGRNYKVFAIFVFISAFFWFLIKFSDQYTVLTQYGVKYDNVPENLSWGEIEEHTIELSTTGSGFMHLSNLILNKKIRIDLSRLKYASSGIYFIMPREQMSYIKGQFPGNVNVIYQQPDSLYFDFSKKINKKIPVILDDSLALAKSFKYKTPVKIIPDSIIVSGPQSKVSRIDSIISKRYIKTNISGNSKDRVLLEKFEDPKLSISDNYVDVLIDVEKYTQNSIQVPVIISNVPDGFILKAFPDKVNIVFNTGLSDFPGISENTFKAVVNYKKVDTLANTTIPVEVELHSDKVELIKVEPNEVEFLLRKISG